MEERRTDALRLLRLHPAWSDRRVAAICTLAPKTVARLRCRVAPGIVDGDARRVGKDGRVWPLRADAVRARIEAALADAPGESLRTIAATVGASPETVRRVRLRLRTAAERAGDSLPFPDKPAGHDSRFTVLRSVGGRRPGPDPAPASSPAWRDDHALASGPHGATFAAWFERTACDGSIQMRTDDVPLSRVYEVADEARRRAGCWNDFALLLENRARRGRAVIA